MKSWVFQAKDVGIRFSQRSPFLFNNVNLVIQPGDIVGITGGNGSGKTSLANVVCGMTESSSGTIFIVQSGEIEPLPSGFIARTFQSIPFIEGLATWRYIVYSSMVHPKDFYWWGQARSYAREPFSCFAKCHEAEMSSLRASLRDELKAININVDILEVPVDRLSMGMRRIVDLLRAMASKSQILVLDEPFANVQESVARLLADRLAETAKEDGRGIIIIDHNIEIVASISRQVFLLTSLGLLPC